MCPNEVENHMTELTLSEKDQHMLSGAYGEGVKMAMSILVRMAHVYDAPELIDISQAHIDGCALMVPSGVEFAETLARLGAKVSIPATLNMIPLDLQNWRRWGVAEEFGCQGERLVKAYTDMGCIPTFTCAPYQGYLTPRFGQQIAWGESNAIAYANSVLGARTNRYGDYLDICMAITGRAPKTGLHLKQNRAGQILVRLVDIPAARLIEDVFYPVFGSLLGSLAGEKIPVIEGLPASITSDQLKALGAAAASSGAVGLFHIIGVTPEAPTREEAFQGGAPEMIIEVTQADLDRSRTALSTGVTGSKLGTVLLGCPHFSFDEFRQLAEIIEHTGGKKHPDVSFIILTSTQSFALLQRSHFIETLTTFGVEFAFDTCVFHSPIISNRENSIMTNSGKCAYYAPGELGMPVVFGSLLDCVQSAVCSFVSLKDFAC